MPRLHASVCIMLLATGAAACGAASNPVVDAAAEAAAVQAASQRLLDAAVARDAAAFAQTFAPDGEFLLPNQAPLIGREAILAQMKHDFSMPDFKIDWDTQQTTIATGSDMAYTRGTYDLSLTTPDGPYRDNGKYLTVWKKVGGEWMVAVDMINSNVPIPIALPATTE